MTPAAPGWWAVAAYRNGESDRYPVVAWAEVVIGVWAASDPYDEGYAVDTVLAAVVVHPDGVFNTVTDWGSGVDASFGPARFTFTLESV